MRFIKHCDKFGAVYVSNSFMLCKFETLLITLPHCLPSLLPLNIQRSGLFQSSTLLTVLHFHTFS